MSAIRSTLLALGPRDELMVLMSGQNSNNALEAIKDPRLKVTYRPKPMKVFEALNTLLEEAQGQLIARMDADDVCLPWRFHCQVRKLKKSQLDFVFSNGILFGKSINPFLFMPQIPMPLNNNQVGLYLALSNPFVHPTMLATKASLTALGGYRPLKAEDLDLWLRGWQAGFRFARTAGYGLLYRIHPEQVTQSSEFIRGSKSEPELQKSLSDQLEALTKAGLIDHRLPTNQALELALRKTSILMLLSRSFVFKKLLNLGNSMLGKKHHI